MKEVLEAIERHLGRSLDIPQLDYYQVVGLELYCDDPERIRTALQSATNTWMQSETGRYPESAQIVGKLLKQAQIILLDPKKRELYDSQLAKLRESQSKAMPTTLGKGSDNASSHSLFPVCDPMQPLNTAELDGDYFEPDTPSSFLASIVAPQNREAELLQLFPNFADLEALTRTRNPSFDDLFEQTDAPKLDSGNSAKAPNGAESLVEQIRRRRIRNRSLVLGAWIAGALGLVGFSSYAFLNNRGRLAKQEKLPEQQQAVAMGERTAAIPRPSRDPSIGDEEPIRPRVISDLPSVRRDGESPPPTQLEPPEPEMEPELPATETIVDPPAPVSPPEPMTSTMESEGPAWKEHMKAARAAIDAEDFNALETEIERALAVSETSQGKDMTARLDQLGQLYKIFVDAFEEAKKKTRGASSIKVGSSAFSIVESDPQKLIVRAGGKNQTYTWDKLPFGIAAAIADLGLSDQEPVDVAARAIYFSLAPAYKESAKNNDLVRKRIEGWFSKSIGKGDVRSDLRQALTDTYE